MLKEQISADLKTAMLARNAFETTVLRGLKASILDEEVKLGKREEGLNDTEIETLVAREVKKRKEAASLLDEERAENELKEAEILSKYLPEMASEEEIRAAVKDEISIMGEVSIKQMGAIISKMKAKFGNSADGAVLAKIVKEELS
ncbi:MAG: GatB/YqeY domain-containing protein [Candidatus Saccharimonas sp.]|nr:MAG: GatB/YqeY domain-containing protein [Candidatus Saccharimonas sp.]